MREVWNPIEKPFRVSVVRSGYYGAHSNGAVKMFATLEEAIEEAEKPQGRGVLSVNVHEAVNAATWTTNGQWEKRFSRKGKKV